MQGFQLTKTHGQHLLANPLVAKSIVEKSEIRPTDVVLEIGPGTGYLTIPLMERAKHVYAVEIDPRMVTELKKKVAGLPPDLRARVTVIHGDFCKIESEKLPRFDLCISNCPYNVSSAIVFKLLGLTYGVSDAHTVVPAHEAHRPASSGPPASSANNKLHVAQPPRKFVLMFQLEFAQGLAAEPGQDQYSRLTVNTKLLARTKILIRVSRNSFRPPPKVDSAVIEIVPTGAPAGLNLDEFTGMTRVLFGRKNKTLGAIFKTKSLLDEIGRNTRRLQELRGLHQRLPGAAGVPVAPAAPPDGPTNEDVTKTILRTLEELGMLDARPGKMSVNDFLRLLCALNTRGIHFR